MISHEKKILYVANGLAGVQIVDLTGSVLPTIVATINPLASISLGVEVVGDVTIVAYATQILTFDLFRKIVDREPLRRF